jgi:hypothetical protein
LAGEDEKQFPGASIPELGRQKGLEKNMDFDWTTWVLIIGGVLLVVLIGLLLFLRSRRPED